MKIEGSLGKEAIRPRRWQLRWAKAKLLGFLAEQPAVELNFNYAAMTEEELMSEIANLNEQARALKPGQLIDH